MEAEDHLPFFTSNTPPPSVPRNSRPTHTTTLTHHGMQLCRAPPSPQTATSAPIGSENHVRVFHCRLCHSASEFTLKVVETGSSSSFSHKPSHVSSEARTLAHLGHPFLPTLYTTITTLPPHRLLPRRRPPLPHPPNPLPP
ncbi:hypothetical protein QJS04_geneDACA022502 [Acorus gramineus]|uniref:Uncharacterized protein n=1 Tax=Acorus gramineus TaxID=55184 RepID=A0AAV9A1X3_ACOGR|nr:hypothetical protein QJS04_geneDACA022502 [Acorus gramineus]